MDFSASLEFRANPIAVFAMLLERDFHEQVCRATGAISHEVDIAQTEAGCVVTTQRVLPATELPDFVRSFVGPTLTVRRIDTWLAATADGQRDGHTIVDIVSAPVKLTGRLALTIDGQGTRESVRGELKASVPFIGGKVERAAYQPIQAAIAAEQTVGTSWLDGLR
jgi:hypothetical protein